MGSPSSVLGLIAGSSQMPRVVASEAAASGRPVWAAAIRGITDPAIDAAVDNVRWLDWGDLPGFFGLLQEWQEAGVAEAIMAGKVEQQRMYDREAGAAIEEIIENLPSGHTDQLLGAVANVLSGAGITLLPSTAYLSRYMPAAGLVAGREPTATELEDVEHGWRVAKALGEHDIGQSVVVKERAVVAVEGMEGTDACIRRAGDLAGAGTVVIKVSKPEQDLRFDVPVVGRRTLEVMREAGAAVLAFEADSTVVFDADAIAELAGERIAVLAHRHD